jgi:parallel beta-helix repeat protein
MSTQYASPTGISGNNGLSTAAPTTVSIAISRATTPGDTIWLMDGLYVGNITLTANGAPGNPITLRALNPGKVKVLGPTNNVAISCRANYLRIQDLEVQARAFDGISIDARGLAAPWHHIEIFDCEIHDCPSGGVQVAQADYITVERCKVWRCAFTLLSQASGISFYQMWKFDDLPGFHNFIRDCLSFDNANWVGPDGTPAPVTDGNGIIMDDHRHTQPGSPRETYTQATLIEGNTCHSNGGRGIHVFLGDSPIVIRNNTIYNNLLSTAMAGENGDLMIYNSSNVRAENNIITNTRASATVRRIRVGSSTNNHANVQVVNTVVDENTNIVFTQSGSNGNLYSGTRVIA